MNTWFRFYNDALNDPKVQQLSPKLFKYWVNLLCIASKNDGQIPPIFDLAFCLRITEEQTISAIDTLERRGLIHKKAQGFTPHSWEERQFKSDTSRDRTAKWRERHRDVTRDGLVTGPDSETDSETDTEQKTPPLSPSGGPAQMLALYNANRGGLPEAKALSKDRLRKCQARLRNNNGTFLSEWTKAVERAAVLPFCCGDGGQGWKVTFDWMITNDTNYLKILEGKYDHVRRAEGPKTKTQLNREAAESILARFDKQDCGSDECADLGRDTDCLP